MVYLGCRICGVLDVEVQGLHFEGLGLLIGRDFAGLGIGGRIEGRIKVWTIRVHDFRRRALCKVPLWSSRWPLGGRVH